MTILDSFKKLAKAWGIKPKGDNIADAVNNVVENIPFGVKTEMVEIVPKQSMTVAETFEGLNVYIVEFFEIIVGKKYETIFNNVKYECTAMSSSDGNPGYIGNAHHIGGPDTGEPFIIVTDGNGNIGCLCKSELGETITLAIYEEQEIVKKLDPKFGGTIVLYSVNWDQEHLFKDKDGNEKITKAELLPLIENGCNIVIVGMEAGVFKWSSNKAYAYVNIMNDSYVEVKVDKNSSDDSLLLFTAEYVGGDS